MDVGFRDFPYESGDLHRRLVRGITGLLLIFYFVQPAIERGSGDAKVLDNLPSGNLEGFHVPEDEKPFVDGVSWVLASLVELFLKDGYLHLELAHLVFEKEYLLGLGIGVHSRKAFEAAFANSS